VDNRGYWLYYNQEVHGYVGPMILQYLDCNRRYGDETVWQCIPVMRKWLSNQFAVRTTVCSAHCALYHI